MYTLDQVRAMRREVNRLGLAGRDVLDKYRDAELRKLCNGVGPDFFPEWARELVTDLRPEAELPAFIHDVEWYEADGTREHFTATNDRFAANGEIVAKARYRWYDPRRYLAIRRAARLARYCQAFGWSQYRECAEEKDLFSSHKRGVTNL